MEGDDRNRGLRRQQLTRLLAPLRQQFLLIPRGGWIADIRKALGMSARQLGVRAGGISSSGILRLEKSEQNRTITLSSLDRVAEGLGCRVVYALVPLEETFDAVVERRAREILARNKEAVRHTMSLEGETLPPQERHSMNEAIELAWIVTEMSRHFWDEDA